MYYKSLLETLKDEGDNRIRVEDEFSSFSLLFSASNSSNVTTLYMVF